MLLLATSSGDVAYYKVKHFCSNALQGVGGAQIQVVVSEGGTYL